MTNLPKPFAFFAAITAATLGFAAGQAPAAKDREPAPVSVSSINYTDNTRDELIHLDAEEIQVNPVSKTLRGSAAAQRYVFIPGELYEADISYEEICQRLTVALAKKGFINAADDQGRVQPDKVDLILRINSGERTWRVPTARIDQLTWRDGLVPRPRGRTLATLGGDVAWDSRAGGNDDALGAAAENANAPGFGFGSSPASPAGASPLSGSSAVASSQAAMGSSEYESTREYYIIVVDAFGYQDLMKKGDHARRLWTTFVAAPRQPGQKFSDVLTTMLRVATPYFGETTRGLQMFNDARAHVDIGTPQVIESDVKPTEKK